MRIELNIRIKTIQFSLNPLFLVILFAMFIAGYVKEYIIINLCMLFHELGHCIMALLLRRKITEIRILPIGFNAHIAMEESRFVERTIIFLGGPVANIILFLFVWTANSLLQLNSKSINFFLVINIYLSAFNMLPILPFDGGLIIKDALMRHLGLFLGSRYLRNISLFLSLTIIIFGIIQFSFHFYNFSLLILGGFTIFNLRLEEMEVAFMNIKQVIYRRSRILSRGIYGARDLVAIKSIHLSQILKSMDFDRFHFIYVLDENLNLLKILTEQEIVNGMVKYNADITLGELIEKSLE